MNQMRGKNRNQVSKIADASSADRNLQTIIIKEMTLDDCSKVYRLQQECFSVPWSLEGLKEMFCTKGYFNYVAEIDGDILGYVGMKAVLDEADITNVAVSPQVRRRGVGKKLLAHLKKSAKENGISTIFLEVRVSNEPAIRLYEQAGFEEGEIRKNYYEKPTEDALIMIWQDIDKKCQ